MINKPKLCVGALSTHEVKKPTVWNRIIKYLRVWKLQRDLLKLVHKELKGNLLNKKELNDVRDIVTKFLIDKRGRYQGDNLDIWHSINDNTSIHLNFKIPKNILRQII